MNIQDKMILAAAVIKDRIAAGESVSKEDRKFLTSFLNVNTRKAPNGGKRKQIKTGK